MAFSFLHRQIWAHPIHKELAVHKLRIVWVQDKGRRVMDQSARARTMSAVRWGHWQNSTVRESAESWQLSVPDWGYKTPLGINLLTQLCPACSMAAPAPHIPGSWVSQIVPTTWKWKQAQAGLEATGKVIFTSATVEWCHLWSSPQCRNGNIYWGKILAKNLQKNLGPRSTGWITQSTGFCGFCFFSLNI